MVFPSLLNGRYDDSPDKLMPAASAFDIVANDFLELAERLGC